MNSPDAALPVVYQLRRLLCRNPGDCLTWMAYFDALEEAGRGAEAAARRKEWLAGDTAVRAVAGFASSPDGIRIDYEDDTHLWVQKPPWAQYLTVRAGFICGVACRLRDWLTHGPELVAEHPVSTVKIVDRGPAFIDQSGSNPSRCVWGAEEAGRAIFTFILPLDVFVLLNQGTPMPRVENGPFYQRLYNAGEPCRDDLSQACLALARRAAFDGIIKKV